MPTAKKTTIVNFVLDKSGSMSAVQDATISGFNEYIATLKKDKKSDFELTLTLFDTEVSTPIKAESIKDVKDLTPKTYNPDGFTALYDAVCRTIKGAKVKKGQKAIMVIMTDGHENASKEYTQVEMQKLIKEKEAEGNWTFVYLGANQDSYDVAQKYGFSHGNISNFNATSGGVVATMRAMGTNTAFMASNSAGAGGGGNFFSKEDQDNLENTK